MQRMRILAYCLISNHWHITGQDAPSLAVVESRRRHRSTSSRLRRRGRRSVCNWPNGLFARPPGWVEVVNAMAAAEELERLRSCIRRSRPFAGPRLGAADGAAAGFGIDASRPVAAKEAIACGKGDASRHPLSPSV
jgi:hypothetical protein